MLSSGANFDIFGFSLELNSQLITPIGSPESMATVVIPFSAVFVATIFPTTSMGLFKYFKFAAVSLSLILS